MSNHVCKFNPGFLATLAEFKHLQIQGYRDWRDQGASPAEAYALVKGATKAANFPGGIPGKALWPITKRWLKEYQAGEAQQ